MFVTLSWKSQQFGLIASAERFISDFWYQVYIYKDTFILIENLVEKSQFIWCLSQDCLAFFCQKVGRFFWQFDFEKALWWSPRKYNHYHHQNTHKNCTLHGNCNQWMKNWDFCENKIVCKKLRYIHIIVVFLGWIDETSREILCCCSRWLLWWRIRRVK